eukprot:364050-Chlamydomonas_euryale.AAC.7
MPRDNRLSGPSALVHSSYVNCCWPFATAELLVFTQCYLAMLVLPSTAKSVFLPTAQLHSPAKSISLPTAQL